MRIITKQDGVLTLVGLNPSFTKAKEMITTTLVQTDEKVQTIKMERIKRDFIQSFATETGLGRFLKDVDWESADEGIKLNGKKRTLQQGELVRIFFFFLQFACLTFFFHENQAKSINKIEIFKVCNHATNNAFK